MVVITTIAPVIPNAGLYQGWYNNTLLGFQPPAGVPNATVAKATTLNTKDIAASVSLSIIKWF
jgi:hypothetical protein